MLPLKEGIQQALDDYHTQLSQLEAELAVTATDAAYKMVILKIDELHRDFSQHIFRDWIDPEKAKNFALASGNDADQFKKKVTVTKCGHKFCSQCLKDWLAELQRKKSSLESVKMTCPYCRTLLNTPDVYRSSEINLPLGSLLNSDENGDNENESELGNSLDGASEDENEDEYDENDSEDDDSGDDASEDEDEDDDDEEWEEDSIEDEDSEGQEGQEYIARYVRILNKEKPR